MNLKYRDIAYLNQFNSQKKLYTQTVNPSTQNAPHLTFLRLCDTRILYYCSISSIVSKML